MGQMNRLEQMGDKNEKPTQLPLDLPVEPRMALDDFIIDQSNQAAFNLISNWPNWPTHLLLLAGPVGSGKSHLARIFANESNATVLDVDDLPTPDVITATDVRAVLVEDLHDARIDEVRLFHLINHVREHNGHMLLTSRSWSESWQIDLPDLRSRLRAAHPIELQEPSDNLLRMVLVKLFADRQLDVDTKLLDYVLVRMERSLSSANRLVRDLDRLSLERRRPITRHLAAELLS